MNRNRDRLSWIKLAVLISLLLFKGVATAAMSCCGPDHSAHRMTSLLSGVAEGSAAPDAAIAHSHHQIDHQADSPTNNQQHSATMHASEMQVDDHQSSCSGCAMSCAAAVLMLDPAEVKLEKKQTERIFSFIPTLLPMTSSGLERPPRF